MDVYQRTVVPGLRSRSDSLASRASVSLRYAAANSVTTVLLKQEKIKVNRYWLFGSMEYYPLGGMHDFRGSFDSVDDAVAKGDSMVELGEATDWHVFDSVDGRVVADDIWSDHVYPDFTEEEDHD